MKTYKNIDNYESLYAVVSDGSIYSYRKKRVLKGTKNKNGYTYVYLHKNGAFKVFLVHRLVAEAFIPNPDNKPEIDHINGNRSDNRVENLRWVSKKENRNNPITTNRMSMSHKGKSAKNKKRVCQYSKDGQFISEYESVQLASIMTNTRRTDISTCISGRQKSANGFVWRTAI